MEMAGSRFKPIKQSRVSEEVAGQLKQSILLGQFRTGEKLPSERKLAEEFEVSRVAIREALRALGNSGFISTRQGSAGGAFVTDLTFEQLSNTYLDLFLANKISVPELHEVRMLVEPEVARSAARNVSAEYAGRLQAALDAEELPLVTLLDDIERKQLVHVILAEMCGNRFFEGLVKSVLRLTAQVVEVVIQDPRHMHPASWHKPLVEAVIAGDGDAAFATMRRHAVEFGDLLIKMENEFREKNAPPGPDKARSPRP